LHAECTRSGPVVNSWLLIDNLVDTAVMITQETHRMGFISRRFGIMILIAYAAILIGGVAVWKQTIAISITDQSHVNAQDTEPPITTPAPPSAEVLAYARQIAEHFSALPAATSDAGEQYVFVSISDGQSPALVALGAGADIPGAIDQALTQLDSLWTHDTPPEWIKLDVVQHTYTFENLDFGQPLPIVRSLNGFALDWASELAFLPEESVAYTLIDSDGLIRFDNIEEYLGQRAVYQTPLSEWSGPYSGDLIAFTSTSVFMQGDEALALYRGHRTAYDTSPEGLVAAALQGGAYLTQAVKDDGSFVYSFLPKSDQEQDDYNIIRHAGTVYAMAEVYAAAPDPALLDAMQRAAAYLVNATVICPGQTTDIDTLCVVEDGWVKLGGNALAIVGLVEYTLATGDEQYLPVMTQMAEWIQEAQRADGSFVQKVFVETNVIEDIDSQYYPGEAILAMTRLAALDGDARWLDVAENAARYLITVRDAGLETYELTHDHWLLYSLNDLYRARPEALYLDHAMRIAEAIVMGQNRAPEYQDWFGSYYRPPRSTPTATRSEGLCAAYQLARDFDLPEMADQILETLEYGIGFQLQTQFQPESAMYLADPQRVLGAFHRDLDNFEIRIDYVQHNISSLLCTAEVLGAK
ncbi:MAG: hypothetical protein JXA10_15445, partial [Anaerolineae bacterium]|nr:hypothetical protein [Anaerolineae bacterium]